jgi:hypothetical protein
LEWREVACCGGRYLQGLWVAAQKRKGEDKSLDVEVVTCGVSELLATLKAEATSLVLRASGLMSRLLGAGSVSCWLHKKLDVEVVEVVVASVGCRGCRGCRSVFRLLGAHKTEASWLGSILCCGLCVAGCTQIEDKEPVVGL